MFSKDGRFVWNRKTSLEADILMFAWDINSNLRHQLWAWLKEENKSFVSTAVCLQSLSATHLGSLPYLSALTSLPQSVLNKLPLDQRVSTLGPPLPQVPRGCYSPLKKYNADHNRHYYFLYWYLTHFHFLHLFLPTYLFIYIWRDIYKYEGQRITWRSSFSPPTM